MKAYNLVLLIAIVALSSCEKKELPVPAHDPGDVINATVNMESDYKWQVYYNLETNSIAGKNLKTAWDIALETTPDGYRVVLNAAKMMYAYNTGKTGMDKVTMKDTVGKKKVDDPAGDMEKTAVGDWKGKEDVYIIDMGVGPDGTLFGFKKLVLKSVDDKGYAIQFANVDGTDPVTLQVTKQPEYNFSFVSFTDQKQVSVEPPKDAWDIAFTQYTHMFIDPPMPYLVTGCLLNRYNATAAIDTTSSFDEITYEQISALNFSPAINTIGYDWKSYTGNTYVTNSKINYIIKAGEGIYYKLHFIDFLNAGVKGNPRWEYQRL